MLHNAPNQRLPAGVPRHAGVLQEVLKHATPGYLVKGIDLFSVRLSKKKKMTTANTIIAFWCDGIKITNVFCQIGKKYTFLMCHRILVIRLFM